MGIKARTSHCFVEVKVVRLSSRTMRISRQGVDNAEPIDEYLQSRHQSLRCPQRAVLGLGLELYQRTTWRLDGRIGSKQRVAAAVTGRKQGEKGQGKKPEVCRLAGEKKSSGSSMLGMQCSGSNVALEGEVLSKAPSRQVPGVELMSAHGNAPSAAKRLRRGRRRSRLSRRPPFSPCTRCLSPPERDVPSLALAVYHGRRRPPAGSNELPWNPSDLHIPARPPPTRPPL